MERKHFWLSFYLVESKREREGGKRENQLLGTPEYYFLSYPSPLPPILAKKKKEKKKNREKTKLLSKLIACRSRAGIKENNQGWWD